MGASLQPSNLTSAICGALTSTPLLSHFNGAWYGERATGYEETAGGDDNES